ncbi:hypothetical protein LCGC14_1217600 [marine sediment metagenome]|uniref:Uncharacterized protein n=1 Tax=marine sediment metagenome TaxID=412755 RepID=A0A0F9LZJ7_9ZZZZ
MKKLLFTALLVLGLVGMAGAESVDADCIKYVSALGEYVNICERFGIKPEPQPESVCRWEWKSTLESSGTSEWEPFAVLEVKETEWGVTSYSLDKKSSFSRGRSVERVRIWLKRQVCEEAK